MSTFRLNRGLPAPAFQRQGGKWEPHAHFTGCTDDRDEIEAIQQVIDNHVDKLVAHYDYCPLRGMYSVELQFESEEAGRACRMEFGKLFTPTGKLKKKYRKG